MAASPVESKTLKKQRIIICRSLGISIIKPELSIIQSKIHEIRGVKVMLDFDLAEIYGVETRVLKQSVKRNMKRFRGEEFMFELSKNEVSEYSRSQFVTLNKGRGSNIKYQPFVFTELGVGMLSSVLNSEKAIEMNRNIMLAFVMIRQYALNYSEISRKLDEYMKNTDMRLDDMCEILDELITQKREFDKRTNRIGFDTSRINT